MKPSLEEVLVGIAATVWFGCLLLLVSIFAGCSSEPPRIENPPLFIDIHCDVPVEERRCFVNVYGAKSVEAYYNGILAWYDLDISNPEDRQSYLDSPPMGAEFLVVACNETRCVERSR